jgi:hypothetical protein
VRSALRWAALAIAVALVAIGVDRVRRQSPRWPNSYRGHWRAARALERGHQVRASDLEEPDDPVARVRLDSLDSLVGRHLREPRAAGDSVTDPQLTLWLGLDPPAAGHMQFAFRTGPLDAPIAFADDTVRTVYGCYAPGADAAFKCSCAPLSILRAHRPTARDSGWVVLEGKRSADIVALIGAEHRVLIRSAPCPPPPKASRPLVCRPQG